MFFAASFIVWIVQLPEWSFLPEQRLERMNKAFKERQTQKTYWAVVEGQLRGKNDLKHFLKKQQNNKAIVFRRPEEGAKEARLSYNVLKTGDNYSLVEVELHTGRHHQIRHNFLP